jgi:dimethylargininase
MKIDYAVLRAVSPGMAHCQLTFLERAPIDLGRAAEEHTGIVQALLEAGRTVIVLPADPALPDSTFTEDTAIVLDEVAVMTHPGSISRRPETAAIAAVLSRFRPLLWMEGPGTLDGGDVVKIGRTLFVGIDTRTNEAGIKELESLITPLGYHVVRVQTHQCLHLKTCATWLGGKRWLANRSWVDARPIEAEGFEILDVPPEEPWAANTLRLGETIFHPAGFPQTTALLTMAGYRVATLPMTELQKAEAGLTCTSLLFSVNEE